MSNGQAIVELKKNIPTIIIPDLHGRREFLADVLAQKYGKEKVTSLLKKGAINVVCLGDGMHTENGKNWDVYTFIPEGAKPLYDAYFNTRRKRRVAIIAKIKTDHPKFANLGNVPDGDPIHQEFRDKINEYFNKDQEIAAAWEKIKTPYYEAKKEMMGQEMLHSLGTMKMVMDLKVKFPDHFHYVRGNHDDMGERIAGFYKYANESEDVKKWIIDQYGQQFLDRYEDFEDKLPLIIKGDGFVASHAAPSRTLTEQEINGKTQKVVKDLVWTDNNAGQTSKEKIKDTLTNLGVDPKNQTWIIGHRPVHENDGKYRQQFDGLLLQVNNPDKKIFLEVKKGSAGKIAWNAKEI